MAIIPDSLEFKLFFLGFNIVILASNIIFFIPRRRANRANKLKFLIILLLGTAVVIFCSTSVLYLTINPDSPDSPIKGIFSNVFFFSLLFSVIIFFCSIFHSGKDITKLEKPSFLKARKGKVKVGTIIENRKNKCSF